MRRVMIGLAVLGWGLALGACHPVANDSAGNPTPPADAPSSASSAPAPADAPSGAGAD